MMWVVIFRAKMHLVDDEYARVAQRLRELATGTCGCLDFIAVNEGSDEVALSYWSSQESIRAWRSHSEHVLAQELGRDRWYESYVVQVAHIERDYRWPIPTFRD
jgi:heme-degrading monooxygenase HmoA